MEFYKLIKLDISSTGQAYADALESDLKKEDLWEHVSKNLFGIITDGGLCIMNHISTLKKK